MDTTTTTNKVRIRCLRMMGYLADPGTSRNLQVPPVPGGPGIDDERPPLLFESLASAVTSAEIARCFPLTQPHSSTVGSPISEIWLCEVNLNCMNSKPMSAS